MIFFVDLFREYLAYIFRPTFISNIFDMSTQSLPAIKQISNLTDSDTIKLKTLKADVISIAQTVEKSIYKYTFSTVVKGKPVHVITAEM